MHALVFEVSHEREDLGQDLPEYFVPSVADWYQELGKEHHGSAVESLKSAMNQLLEINTETGEMKAIFTEEALKKYFQSDYENFRKELGLLQSITLEQFAGIVPNRIETSLYRLKDAYEGSTTYIYLSDDGEVITLESFLRRLKPGEQMYLGTVWDYHI